LPYAFSRLGFTDVSQIFSPRITSWVDHWSNPSPKRPPQRFYKLSSDFVLNSTAPLNRIRGTKLP